VVWKNAGDGVYSHELLQQRFVFVTKGNIMGCPYDISCCLVVVRFS
jgi:hypothetical protein